jgi:hypothetical protein
VPRTRVAGFALLTALVLMLLMWPRLIVGSFLVLIPPSDSFSVSALTTAGCYVLALYAALVLAEPRKRVVLYLRRFRSVSANELMGRAIDAGLGRRFRVVTLDDANFRPIEIPRTERRVSVFSTPLMASGGVLLFVALAYYAVITPLQRSAPRPIPSRFFGVYLIAFGQSIWQSPVWAAISGLILVIFTFLMVHRWRVRLRSRLRVRVTRDLDRCTYRVEALASWQRRPGLLAPQATVIRVVDELWQATVARLLDYVDAVIVDVSAVTENVLWEVRTIKARTFVPCVWIGDARVIAAWPDSRDPLTAMLCTLISRNEVVTYDLQLSGAERRLRRDLSAALEHLPYMKPRHGPGTHIRPAFWRVAAAGLLGLVLYATVGLLVCLSNAVLFEVVKWYIFRIVVERSLKY